MLSHLCILPKCVKTREPEDEHCVLLCTYISYCVCDPIPLDNPKNHTALPYTTWGLIQDIKIKKEIPTEIKSEEYQLTNFTGLPLGISKTGEGNSMWTSHEERRKILVVKFIASKNRKSKSSNSSIWDELKFETRKFITSGLDKRNRIGLEDKATNKDKKIIG